MLDIDNDGDLDLALVDELEDVVILMKQDGPFNPDFVRGDCNQDNNIDIGDSVFLLDALFSMGTDPACQDSCDANDDGGVNIADAVFLLEHLFNFGAPPPSPHPGCGPDPTADPLGCGAFPACP